MKIMKFLKSGDPIEIIAPASACSKEELLKAIDWLKNQGFKPVYDKNILKPQHYIANSDEMRFKFLKKALENKKTKAVWCLRGGYGSLRLVPHLLKLKKMKPKFFIGLSDITILHHFLNTQWGWPTIHGPVLARTASENKRSKDYEELFGLLKGENNLIEFKNLKPMNKAAQKSEINITAKVFGGNLCTYTTLLGSKLQPHIKDYFLFLEDCSERGYKVDRMLHQLDQAGIFKQCKAVFLGDFIDSKESNGNDLVPYAIKNFFKNSKIPVFSGVESDHSEKQRPLVFNTEARLIKRGRQSTLKVTL